MRHSESHAEISRFSGRLRHFLTHHAWGIGAIAFFLILKASGVLQTLELNQLDFLLGLLPEEPLDSKILIVEIDDRYLETLREKHGGLSYFEYQDLAELTQKIWEQQPSVVALDVVSTSLSGQGREALVSLFSQHSTMLATEKAFRPVLPPISGIPEEQLAFNDFPRDVDGKIRRTFLGSYNLDEDNFKKSLSFRLAEVYLLKEHGINSVNGIKDPESARFDKTEIPRIKPNQEPYVGKRNKVNGVQTLLHFRRQSQPFESISAQAILDGSADFRQIKDKIVLVGITAPAIAPYLNTSVPRNKLNQTPTFQSETLGVELQAHATSQIVNGVLEDRRLLRGLHQAYTYGLIIIFGLLGCLFGRSSENLAFGLFSLLLGIVFFLIVLYFLFLEYGLYIFARFSIASLIVTGVGHMIITQREIVAQETAVRKAAEEEAKAKEVQLTARLRAIEDTFGEIHNGPLQILSIILRQIQDGETSIPRIETQLKDLNQRIRLVGEHLKQEAKTGGRQVLLRPNQTIDLAQPLHELFYDIYYQSLQADWANLKHLKIKSRAFDPIPDIELSKEDKGDLCLFLEEAITNVGKHADGATKLSITGKKSEKYYTLSIRDNGCGLKNVRQGSGSKIAHELERRLAGQFFRTPLKPKGIDCRFIWPLQTETSEQDQQNRGDR